MTEDLSFVRAAAVPPGLPLPKLLSSGAGCVQEAVGENVGSTLLLHDHAKVKTCKSRTHRESHDIRREPTAAPHVVVVSQRINSAGL